MDERDITNLLQSDVDEHKHGWHCPDTNQLAAYLNKRVAAASREEIEKHFADCKACLDSLAFLISETGELELVPTQLLVRARALATTQSSPLWRWRWAMATATACLIIAVVFIVWKSPSSQRPENLVAQVNQPSPSPQSPSPTVSPTTTESGFTNPRSKIVNSNTPTTRGGTALSKPSILLPREGTTIKTNEQTVRWKTMPDTDFYELRIVTEDGRAVLTERVNETHYVVPASILQTGTKYFVNVIAHLHGGRTISSDLVTFRVSGP